MTEPSTIYLQPPGHEDPHEGRLWCEDPAPLVCPDCGAQPTRYVRGELYDQLVEELSDAKRQITDLESPR